MEQRETKFKIDLFITKHSGSIEITLFIIIGLLLLLKGLLLIYPDLNLNYPFMTPDSYDWIANGLKYLGFDVFYSARAPGLPLIIAFLEKIKALNILPLINQFALFGIIVTIYKTLRRYFDIKISLFTSLLLFLSFFLQSFSLYILADIYALFFITLGCLYYLKSKSKNSYYVNASLFFSISILFQYALVFLAPAVAIHFLIYRKKIDLKILAYSALPPIIAFGSWCLYRKIAFGSFFYSDVDQGALIRFHLGSIGYYLFSVITVLGVFSTILLVIGISKYLWLKKDRNDFTSFNFLAVCFWFIFWALAYDWNDKRFALYLIPFIFFFISLGIKHLFEFVRKISPRLSLLVYMFILLAIFSGFLSYESPFTFEKLLLTRQNVIKFDVNVPQDSANFNINFKSYKFIAEQKNHFPLDFVYLVNLKNKLTASGKTELTIEKLSAVNSKEICAKLASADKSQWYIIRNKFGNAAKKKLALYPMCPTPDILILEDGSLGNL